MLFFLAIRHCHLYKRSHFDGYGFNLYKKTREELHIIGSLEPGSPGLDGGLRLGILHHLMIILILENKTRRRPD